MPTEPKNNFDVLIRILDNRGPDGTVMSGPEDDDVSSVLTDQVSQQIKQGVVKGGPMSSKRAPKLTPNNIFFGS